MPKKKQQDTIIENTYWPGENWKLVPYKTSKLQNVPKNGDRTYILSTNKGFVGIRDTYYGSWTNKTMKKYFGKDTKLQGMNPFDFIQHDKGK